MIRAEAALQVEIAAFLDALRLPWFHPANERRCSAVQGALLKRAGVKAGIPDVLIFRAHMWSQTLPDGILDYADRHGLAIELKSPGNYPTPEQRAWLERLQAEGWTTAVCRSLSQVVDVLHDCSMLQHPETGRPLDMDNARHGFITEAR
jgi:hypothetical protein